MMPIDTLAIIMGVALLGGVATYLYLRWEERAAAQDVARRLRQYDPENHND